MPNLEEYFDFTRRMPLGSGYVWCKVCEDWVVTQDVICDPAFGSRHINQHIKAKTDEKP